MKGKVSLDSVYVQSENVVSRNIEGEIIIVPIVAGIGDIEDELFTLNKTGKTIWEMLDGQKDLGTIAYELLREFKAPLEEIEKDILGLVQELYERQIVVESSNR